MASRIPIGQILIQEGVIDEWQLESALAHQRSWGGRIGEALVSLGFIAERELLTNVARQLSVPYIEIGIRHIPRAIVELVPERLVRERKVFPIARAQRGRRGLLVVATDDPDNLAALDEVSFATGMLVKPALASRRDIERTIERHLGEGRSRWSEGAKAPAAMKGWPMAA